MTKTAKFITVISFYIFGILAFFYPVFWGVSILLLLFGLYYVLKNKSISVYFLLFPVSFFLFGCLNVSKQLFNDDDLSSFTDNNNVSVKAEVLSIPTNNVKGKTKFYARVSSVSHDDDIKEHISAKTLVTISNYENAPNKIKTGDILKLTGRLKSPEHSLNPYQFDYARYLQFKNTFSLLYVTDDWEILPDNSSLKAGLIRKLNEVRTNILNIHGQNIKSPMIEILGGIIFGDDAVNPDDDTKQAFMKSGIFHILAASGMNVTLIFGIWFFIAKTLRFNYKFSIVFGMLLISVYTCMTGFGPPIIRAFLMLCLILIGKLADRAASTMSLLFIVAFLMLLYNPLLIFDVGFQLSFIVTFSLILTAPVINFNIKNKYVNSALGACMIPFIAQIFASPLQMYYFNTFSPYFVMTNIAVIPVLSIVSFLGFSSSLVALIPSLAQKVCFVADFILNPLLLYIVKAADFFSSLPYSVVYLKQPSVLQLFLYFFIVIVSVLFIRYKVRDVKYYALFFVVVFAFVFSFVPFSKNASEITFFAVENADAIMIKSPRNGYYLVDTGKLPYMSSSSQAKMIIINYMRNAGIKELDGLILSHFDSDHAGGTTDILKELNVKNIYIPDSFEDTNLSSNIMNFLNNNNYNPVIVKDDTVIAEEKDFCIKALRAEGEKIKSENEKSIVVLFRDKDKKVLLTGDGNTNTYDYLPDEYKKNLTVLKVGHHGAKDTLNTEMINNSEYFVISTGVNIYNHPDIKTIELLDKSDKHYFRTDKYNAVRFVFKDNKVGVFAYSPKKHDFQAVKAVNH